MSHTQIVDWIRKGRGAAVTEILEARLKSLAKALNDNANLANTVLQRVNGGEWTGNAATVAAEAMRALRDFDDTMRHHGETNDLAAFGQSDNSSWVRASVPPVVDAWSGLLPTGGPADVLDSTVDFYHQLRAAKDAEEQARQVMREYETMTVERVTSLPPLAPAPQVVVSGREDEIVVGPRDHVRPRGGQPGKDDGDDGPRQGGPVKGEPQAHPDPGRSPGDASSGRDRVGGSPNGSPDGSRQTDPSGALPDPSGALPVGAGEMARTVGGAASVAGGREPSPGGVFPWLGDGEPGVRGGQAGVSRVIAEGRGRQGVLPVGAAGSGKSDEDKEHQGRYAVPESEIFEPDGDGGLLLDPFRPGSFVVPGSIGDDDDE